MSQFVNSFLIVGLMIFLINVSVNFLYSQFSFFFFLQKPINLGSLKSSGDL